ncbi:MAG: MFS transporter [Sphingomonadales bacterium]
MNPSDQVAAAQRIAEDAANDRFVAANLKRNFIANFGHGMLGMTGFRLVNAPTFVPAYVFMLTGSSMMVGLCQALQQTGAILSPLLSASAIEDKARILPIAIRTGMLMRVQLLGLALTGWLLSGPWLVASILLFLFLFGYFNGAQRVTFQMLMAKVIPLAQRGRLQGYRNLAGGAIAAALSWWAGSTLIANNIFGNGYATTFMLSFILTSLGLMVLTMLIREPDSHRRRAPMTLRSRLRELPQLLADRSYKFFLVAQLLSTAGRIGVPFCILHAGQVMTLDGHALGLFSFAFLGADTVANLAWGAIGDRKGFRLVFLASILMWVGGFALMLVAGDAAGFVIAFAALGTASAGYMMSAQTLVLEFGAREDIAMRLAISTTVETSIAAIGPLLGGVIATSFGFATLISLSTALLVMALMVLLFLVDDPRHARSEIR